MVVRHRQPLILHPMLSPETQVLDPSFIDILDDLALHESAHKALADQKEMIAVSAHHVGHLAAKQDGDLVVHLRACDRGGFCVSGICNESYQSGDGETALLTMSVRFG